MRLTLGSRFVYAQLQCALMALGAAWSVAFGAPQTATSRPAVEEVADALFHVRQLNEVSISPDGTRVSWVESHEDAETGAESLSIYTRDPRTSGAAVRVTAGKGAAEFHEYDMAWSPDGKHLAFLSDAEKEGQLQLYIADLPAGHVRRITSVAGAWQRPSWSPDGKSIAILFTANAPRKPGPLEPVIAGTGVISEQIYNQRITIVDPASGKVRQVSPADLYVHEYDWSPDGKTFVATAAPGPGDANWYLAQIYTIAADTGKTISILKTAMQIANPVWSPDGKRVAFIGGLMSDEVVTGGDVFAFPASGGELRDLTPARKSVSPMAALAAVRADPVYRTHGWSRWDCASRSFRPRSQATVDGTLEAGAGGDARWEEFRRDPRVIPQSAGGLGRRHWRVETDHAGEWRVASSLGRVQEPALDE